MANQWYYVKNGNKQGPVSTKTLNHLAQTGHLQVNDLVWIEGMTKWEAASSIQGLFAASNNDAVLPAAALTTFRSCLVGWIGWLGLVLVCFAFIYLVSIVMTFVAGPSTLTANGFYPEELALKHESVYLVHSLYDFSAQQFAVGVDQNGKSATVYWRFTTVFREFNATALEDLINDNNHARRFKVSYALESNILKGTYEWTPNIVGDSRFTRGGFGFELKASQRFTPETVGATRILDARFKEHYQDLDSMTGDFDALYVVHKSDLPSPRVQKVVVGVFGKKPDVVIFANWGTGFERLIDANCGGLPKEDVIKASVSYTGRFADVKGELAVTRSIVGFEPKTTVTPFSIRLKDGMKYKGK